MEELLSFDYRLFHLINQVWVSPGLDAFMMFMRNQYVWGPLYIFLVGFVLFNYGKQGGLYLLLLICTLSVSDLVSSRLIKKNVERLRPCNQVELEGQRRVLVRCGSGFSFTSSHATNHFTVATFMVASSFNFLGKARFLFLVWAACIAYAQVYVGVHFPTDVLAGSLVGAFIGFTGSKISNFFLYR